MDKIYKLIRAPFWKNKSLEELEDITHILCEKCVIYVHLLHETRQTQTNSFSNWKRCLYLSNKITELELEGEVAIQTVQKRVSDEVRTMIQTGQTEKVFRGRFVILTLRYENGEFSFHREIIPRI